MHVLSSGMSVVTTQNKSRTALVALSFVGIVLITGYSLSGEFIRMWKVGSTVR